MTLYLVLAFFMGYLTHVSCQEQFILSGQHFRVTAVHGHPWLQYPGAGDATGSATGYLPEMFEEISRRANFTFEFHSPTGLGSHCTPQLTLEDTEKTYGYEYIEQYDCGMDDVNELQGTEFATDMYLGMFYITPDRQSLNRFTVPFAPPFKGTPAMFGTATGLRNMEDLVREQIAGRQSAACALGSSALPGFLRSSYPDMNIREYFGGSDYLLESFGNGTCAVAIIDAPFAAQFVLQLSHSGKCIASNGKPVGIVGEPMEFGLSHYAIGVKNDVDISVVHTLSYWINTLMAEGFLAEIYKVEGGTGRECGYVLFPQEETPDRLLSDGKIVAAVIVPVVVIALTLYIWHYLSLKRQEKRYKKRFVQQIARNIEIGPSPGSIPPEKLFEEILHIGDGKSFISKDDLSKWLLDVRMDFLSKKDFEALWNAMDVNETGKVDPVEFVVFLSACGPEFSKVYRKQQNLPKSERLKLAARRLSNFATMGEDGVRQLERSLNRRSGAFKPSGPCLSSDVRSSARNCSVGDDITVDDP